MWTRELAREKKNKIELNLKTLHSLKLLKKNRKIWMFPGHIYSGVH